jgi:hypothetical protein
MFLVGNIYLEDPMMNTLKKEATYPLDEALRAQKALRELAGLGPERFPIEAFVGMVSDEIEALRKQGHSDEEIAGTIAGNSAISITADDIAAFYAPHEQRHAG